jgi:hypothetical protein
MTPGPLPRRVHKVQAWLIGTGHVFIGWVPEGGPILGFAIWRKGGGSDWALAGQLINPGATGFIDSGLKSDTPYVYRVRTVGTHGTSEWSDEVEVLTPSPNLTAPSSLAGTVVSSTQVNLTWSMSGVGETGYSQLCTSRSNCSMASLLSSTPISSRYSRRSPGSRNWSVPRSRSAARPRTLQLAGSIPTT